MTPAPECLLKLGNSQRPPPLTTSPWTRSSTDCLPRAARPEHAGALHARSIPAAVGAFKVLIGSAGAAARRPCRQSTATGPPRDRRLAGCRHVHRVRGRHPGSRIRCMDTAGRHAPRDRSGSSLIGRTETRWLRQRRAFGGALAGASVAAARSSWGVLWRAAGWVDRMVGRSRTLSRAASTASLVIGAGIHPGGDSG